jgi:hypothetical protein
MQFFPVKDDWIPEIRARKVSLVIRIGMYPIRAGEQCELVPEFATCEPMVVQVLSCVHTTLDKIPEATLRALGYAEGRKAVMNEIPWCAEISEFTLVKVKFVDK